MTASRMNKETRERRRIIIEQLPDDYTARTKKTQTKIKWALDEAGIKTSIHLIRADLSLIRSTYRFLKGNESERASLLVQAEKNHPNVSAIRYFQKCGLDTWDKVLEAAKRADAKEQNAAQPTTPEAKDAVGMFLASAQALADELRAARAEYQKVLADNLGLQERLLALETRIGAFDVGQLTSFLSLIQELQTSPRPQLVASAPVPPLSNFPEGPQYSEAFHKPVVYTDQFTRNARQLDRNARTELMRALKILTDHGFRDPRIKCASRPGTLSGYMNCKIFKMFMIWEESSKELRIHWIESGGKPIGK